MLRRFFSLLLTTVYGVASGAFGNVKCIQRVVSKLVPIAIALLLYKPECAIGGSLHNFRRLISCLFYIGRSTSLYLLFSGAVSPIVLSWLYSCSLDRHQLLLAAIVPGIALLRLVSAGA